MTRRMNRRARAFVGTFASRARARGVARARTTVGVVWTRAVGRSVVARARARGRGDGGGGECARGDFEKNATVQTAFFMEVDGVRGDAGRRRARDGGSVGG